MKRERIPYSKTQLLQQEKTLQIDTYKWSNTDYRPDTDVFLCHNGTALKVKFVVFEKEAYYSYITDDSAVWCDSCVEFFLKPYPNDQRYLNIEVNSVGAMIFAIGESRVDRKSLVQAYKPSMQVETNRNFSFWSVQYELPFGMIQEIYGAENPLHVGDTFQGNFYKCGDETPYLHYGMWNEIPCDLPDFHTPEFFGQLFLSK